MDKMGFPQGLSLGDLYVLGDGCSFLLAQKGTKDAPRGSFDEHLGCAGVHRRRPLDPIYVGRSPVR